MWYQDPLTSSSGSVVCALSSHFNDTWEQVLPKLWHSDTMLHLRHTGLLALLLCCGVLKHFSLWPQPAVLKRARTQTTSAHVWLMDYQFINHFIWICMCIYIYTCKYYIYICMYVCMNAYTYIYIYTHTTFGYIILLYYFHVFEVFSQSKQVDKCTPCSLFTSLYRLEYTGLSSLV